MPTIIKVDINAAICTKPAPLFNKADANGNATKPGINVIDPTKEAINTPIHPDCTPINPDITSGLKTASIIPIINNTAKNCGSIFSKDFQAFFKANHDFCSSFIKGKDKQTKSDNVVRNSKHFIPPYIIE